MTDDIVWRLGEIAGSAGTTLATAPPPSAPSRSWSVAPARPPFDYLTAPAGGTDPP